MMKIAEVPAGGQSALSIDGPAGRIELLVDMPASKPLGIALLGHPQPLLGGSARHKISQFLARGLQAEGWIAVRPNFRGVGTSEGAHDEGAGESEDMTWLCRELRGTFARLPLALVGFSFGAFVLAWTAHALAQSGMPADRVVLAGFPVGSVEGQRHYAPPPPAPETLIVHGERDERVPLQSVMDWCREQDHPLMVMPGADHFFAGRLPALRSLVLGHLRGTSPR